MCQANKSTLTLRTFNELSPSSQPLVRVAALGNRNIAERAAFFNDDGLPRHCYPHARPQRRTQLHRDGPRSVSASLVTTREMPAQCAAVSHLGQDHVVDTSTQPERSRVRGRVAGGNHAAGCLAHDPVSRSTTAPYPWSPTHGARSRSTCARRPHQQEQRHAQAGAARPQSGRRQGRSRNRCAAPPRSSPPSTSPAGCRKNMRSRRSSPIARPSSRITQ